jgi:two-component system LytT family sensor kinase
MVESLHDHGQTSLNGLRHHTSPHFLFNALNSVESLSRQDPERIPELVRGLSACLRYWLQPTRDRWVTLQQELDSVTSYLRVEQIRFEDQFEVAFEIAEAARNRRVPQFFLQPLVERAIRDGLGAEVRPLSVLVSCRCLEDVLRVEVKHTGVASGAGAALGGGIDGLRRRLDEMYGTAGYGWTASEPADWVSLTIELPLGT